MADTYTLAFNLIDEVDSSDSYWLPETGEDYSIFEPPMSSLFSLNMSSNDIFSYPAKEEISNSHSLDEEVTETADIADNFMTDDYDNENQNPNPISSLSVKKKLKLAFEFLGEILKDSEILIQIWMPVSRGGKIMLTTKSQAFFLSLNCESLSHYRDVSKSFQFAGEEEYAEENEGGGDIVSRVFMKKLPEWTPDVKLFSEDEYLRVAYAQQLNICGSIVLPILKPEDTSCLGVIEIITTTQKVNFNHELESIMKTLEAVDLRSCEIMCSHMPKDPSNDSYEAALAEIQQILKFVCDQHGLPLAQTWASCSRQGRSGLRHSESNYSQCVSPINSACYTPHPEVSGFHEVCSEHHLLKGQGLVGEAFTTNQPCFSSDISAFSNTKEYPLAHYASIFGLRASIAVRLRSVYTGPSADFVLEFFLPIECKDTQQQQHMLGSISSSIQQVSRSLRVVTDEELLEEAMALERESVTPPTGRSTEDEQEEEKENIQMFHYSHSSQNLPQSEEEESWFMHMMEAQQEHKPTQGEFKLTTHWIEDDQSLNDYALEVPNVEYEGYEFCFGENFKSRGRKPVQRRQTKTEKSISLQMLRPYFAGSLKDAAKSIGVCPTTLKRICRQHGISRWPSRKIKKVEHSLRKLQHVIDSVQGVEDSFRLGSLYSTLKINNHLNKQFTIEGGKKFEHDLKSQGQVDNPMVIQAPPVHDGKLIKLKVTFGEERIRFSMQQNWKFNDLLSEIVKRYKIEHCDNRRIEIKYLDDDSEWVILESDADLEECLDVHNTCASTLLKLSVNLGL